MNPLDVIIVFSIIMIVGAIAYFTGRCDGLTEGRRIGRHEAFEEMLERANDLLGEGSKLKPIKTDLERNRDLAFQTLREIQPPWLLGPKKFLNWFHRSEP